MNNIVEGTIEPIEPFLSNSLIRYVYTKIKHKMLMFGIFRKPIRNFLEMTKMNKIMKPNTAKIVSRY